MPVFDAKLDDLLPKPSKKIRDGIKQAQLVLITSQEIDELWSKTISPRPAARWTASCMTCGVASVSWGNWASPRSFWPPTMATLADEIGEDMKIDAPAATTADLHRRVWVGVGGTAEPSYLRTSLASFGVDSELDIATPWTFACFKAKGERGPTSAAVYRRRS